MNLVRFAPHSDTLGAPKDKDSLVYLTEPVLAVGHDTTINGTEHSGEKK